MGLGLSKKGNKKAYPIPVVKEKLPHKNVLPEFLVEGNRMSRVADPSSEIDNPLDLGPGEITRQAKCRDPMRD